MRLMVRSLIKPMIVTTLVGFVVRRLMAADDARAKRVGFAANKFMGHPFGPDADELAQRHRVRAFGRTAATAAAGGAMEYFFDPMQGAERRARMKRFASEHLRRNGHGPILLPENSRMQAGVPTQAMSPGLPA